MIVNRLWIEDGEKTHSRATSLKDTTRSIVVIWVHIFQNKFMVEIYFKSLVRAIGEVLVMKCS